MNGVLIEGAQLSPRSIYRDELATCLRIEVRNPPLLSAFGAVGGVLLLGYGATGVIAALHSNPVRGFWWLAWLVFGLIVLSLALGAFRAHTQLVIVGERLVIQRRKSAPPARYALAAIDRVHAGSSPGEVCALIGNESVVIAGGLLPEQATRVATALDHALGPK